MHNIWIQEVSHDDPYLWPYLTALCVYLNANLLHNSDLNIYTCHWLSLDEPF